MRLRTKFAIVWMATIIILILGFLVSSFFYMVIELPGGWKLFLKCMAAMILVIVTMWASDEVRSSLEKW